MVIWMQSSERNNLSASRKPIDPNLKTDISAPQIDGPSARHAAGKKDDRSAGFPTVACLGEQGVERNVARQLNAVGARRPSVWSERPQSSAVAIGVSPNG